MSGSRRTRLLLGALGLGVLLAASLHCVRSPSVPIETAFPVPARDESFPNSSTTSPPPVEHPCGGAYDPARARCGLRDRCKPRRARCVRPTSTNNPLSQIERETGRRESGHTDCATPPAEQARPSLTIHRRLSSGTCARHLCPALATSGFSAMHSRPRARAAGSRRRDRRLRIRAPKKNEHRAGCPQRRPCSTLATTSPPPRLQNCSARPNTRHTLLCAIAHITVPRRHLGSPRDGRSRSARLVSDCSPRSASHSADTERHDIGPLRKIDSVRARDP